MLSIYSMKSPFRFQPWPWPAFLSASGFGFLLICAAGFAPAPAAALPESVSAFERFSGTWVSERVGKTITYRVLADNPADSEPRPVIAYVRNPAWERVGTEPDETILLDFLDGGYLVAVLDYEGDPAAVSPAIDWDLAGFRHFVLGHNQTSLFAGSSLQPHPLDVFVLPEGYRLERDLFYWDVARHGAHGTLQRILNTYNGHVVSQFGVAPAASPEEMRGPDGEEIDYRLSLDIIYPSQPAQPVPLVFESATQSERMRGHRVEIDRAPFPIGFVNRGMAWAITDHCWNPLARHFHYGYWSQYSLDDWNGLAAATAAARFFRFHANAYGIDPDRIGAMGHSKGAYAVTRLSDPDHVRQSEHFSFSGHPQGSPEAQPWPWRSSRINVGYQSMGNGTRRTQYVSPRNVPTVIACGRFDEFNHWDVFPDLVGVYEEHGLNHLALWMTDLGHTLPRNFDNLYQADRYEMTLRFFEAHLTRPEEAAPVLLHSFPAAGSEADDPRGRTRQLPPAELLPEGGIGDLAETGPITLAFARAVDAASVGEGGVRILRAADGAEVAGEWSATRQDTRLRFEPGLPLRDYEPYLIELTPSLLSATGVPLPETVTIPFVAGPLSPAYAAWTALHPDIPEESRGSRADPFGRGLPNLLAYALDLDPRLGFPGEAVALSMETGPAPSTVLTWREPRAELRYIPEISPDLVFWTRDYPDLEIRDLPGNHREARVKSGETGDRLFLRLAVEADVP